MLEWMRTGYQVGAAVGAVVGLTLYLRRARRRECIDCEKRSEELAELAPAGTDVDTDDVTARGSATRYNRGTPVDGPQA